MINSTQPPRVRLVIKRDVGAETIWDAFDEGIQANSSPAELSAIQKELAEIEKLFTDLGKVKEGDVVDMDFTPNGDTIVTYQNQPKGKISIKRVSLRGETSQAPDRTDQLRERVTPPCEISIGVANARGAGYGELGVKFRRRPARCANCVCRDCAVVRMDR